MLKKRHHVVIYRISLVVLSLLFCKTLVAQKACYSKKVINNTIIDAYKGFFEQIGSITNPLNLDDDEIKKYTLKNILIENDFIYDSTNNYLKKKTYFSWDSYVDDINHIQNLAAVEILSIDINENSIRFAKVGSSIFVWLRKSIVFYYEGKNVTASSNILLTLVDDFGKLMIQKITRAESIPADNDNDQIADLYDNCKKSYGQTVNLSGCIDDDRDCDGITNKEDDCPDIPGDKSAKGCPDSDGDGVPDGIDECTHTKGPKSNEGCPNPPFARIELNFKVIGGLPFGSPFTQTNSYQSSTNSLNPGIGFAKYSVGGSLDVNLNVKRWIGLGVGYAYLKIFTDYNSLTSQLKSYLRNNGYVVNSLDISQQGYNFNMVYGKIYFGDINSNKWSFKVGPSYIYFMPIKMNPIKINVNYSGSPQQIDILSLTPDAFWGYGGSAMLMYRVGDSRTRLHLSASYISSIIPFTKEKVQFQTLPSKLEFSDSKLKLGTIEFGVIFSLKKPKKLD